ncbi:hypothetical protein RQM59_04720 [Flavobacteriaceae bacterium S356]|uniref:Uncharacterized protein n=1 Tax=Asprobacillus argus TaxID=3076534 RepID=A0ABU3LD81_9FLAO|nr:hypothetical protein [Flavobacteriaceae bacterium S356]
MDILRFFYGFALISSVLNIYSHATSLTSITVLVGVLGIISAILFFSKQYKFYYLGIIWIVLQIPYVVFENNVYDFSQFINAHFSWQFGAIHFGFNFHIVLLLTVKYLILTKYLNQRIVVKPFTESAKETIKDSIEFKPKGILYSKRLSAKVDLEIKNTHYSKLLFQPTKSDRIQKAGITLVPSESGIPLKATVSFEVKE